MKITKTPNGTATATATAQKAEVMPPTSSSAPTTTVNVPSYLFAEKLIPVLVDLMLQAPAVEKYIIYPEVIQSLGRYTAVIWSSYLSEMDVAIFNFYTLVY